MSTECLIKEQQELSATKEVPSAVHTNGHHDALFASGASPHGTGQSAQHATTLASSSLSETAEIHTKELLDEALDSVKNVLMQTFKKNLESGGDLSALKSTLGSDEVAEVFLAKLRQSLKRDNENDPKPQEIHIDADSRMSQCSTPSSSSNALMSPVMSVPVPAMGLSDSPLPDKLNSPSSPASVTAVQTPTTPTQRKKSATPVLNVNRFDGATEEELAKRILQDVLQPNLDIVFVGVNPSLYAVHKGHHYGGPGNHFWKLLHLSGLIPSALNSNDDFRMPQFGIGFTNVVQRPSKAGADITKEEINAGAEVLIHKMKIYRPKIIAFNGRGIYEVYAGNKHFHYGKQPEPFPGTDTHVFVMPSSSARCSQLPRAEDKLPFYVGLRKLRDFIHGALPSLNEAEITFPDIKIKDTDDASQKTVIRISNKPFSELSAETRKSFGDKIPSSQLIAKPQPVPSPPNAVLNTDALTTQTMSILHHTNHQPNENLLVTLQQPQRVSLSMNGTQTIPTIQPRLITNGVITSNHSFMENTSTNSTNAAVLAALASGDYSSSSTPQQTIFQPTQTVYVGGQQHQSYPIASPLNKTPTVLNVRPPVTVSSHPSFVVHHQPQSSAVVYQSSSPISRPMTFVSTSSPLPSFNTLLNSTTPATVRTPTTPCKDPPSSQPSTPKQISTIAMPSVKPATPTLAKPSTITVPKPPNPVEKRPINSTIDECLYVRYERDSQATNADQFRFSYIIDEHAPGLHKRLRYVSINDL